MVGPLKEPLKQLQNARSFRHRNASKKPSKILRPIRISSLKRLNRLKKTYLVKSKARTPPRSNKIQEEISPKEQEIRTDLIYKEHLFATFQALKLVRRMNQVDPAQLKEKKVHLPKRPGYEAKKTLIFDLDETLVHCCEDDPDYIIPIALPTGENVHAGINIRPHAVECLEFANRHFEVIVFTASHSYYADKVLDFIDPDRVLVHHRLYRENCVSVDELLVKDLRIFANRKLKDMVIIDNNAYSFAYQLENGVPIISWKDDYADKELFNLMDYLKLLADAKDVREINRKTFKLNTFYEDYIKEVFEINAESNK